MGRGAAAGGNGGAKAGSGKKGKGSGSHGAGSSSGSPDQKPSGPWVFCLPCSHKKVVSWCWESWIPSKFDRCTKCNRPWKELAAQCKAQWAKPSSGGGANGGSCNPATSSQPGADGAPVVFCGIDLSAAFPRLALLCRTDQKEYVQANILE